MPIIQIDMLEGRTLEQKRQMVKEVTEALAKNLACSKNAVSIVIREVSRENLARAGELFVDKN